MRGRSCSTADRALDVAADIADLAMLEGERARFRSAALARLQAELGFDLGAIQSASVPAVDTLDGTPFLPPDLGHWLRELREDELRYFATRKTRDVLEGIPRSRLERLTVGRELIRPFNISSCATTLWIFQGGPSSIVLVRTGRSRPFSLEERAIIDAAAPVVAAADGQLSRQRFSACISAKQPRASLTAAEQRVAHLAARGLTNRDIAAVHGSSPNTVRNQLQRVFEKLEVSNRAELAFVWSAKDSHAIEAIDQAENAALGSPAEPLRALSAIAGADELQKNASPLGASARPGVHVAARRAHGARAGASRR